MTNGRKIQAVGTDCMLPGIFAFVRGVGGRGRQEPNGDGGSAIARGIVRGNLATEACQTPDQENHDDHGNDLGQHCEGYA